MSWTRGSQLWIPGLTERKSMLEWYLPWGRATWCRPTRRRWGRPSRRQGHRISPTTSQMAARSSLENDGIAPIRSTRNRAISAVCHSLSSPVRSLSLCVRTRRWSDIFWKQWNQSYQLCQVSSTGSVNFSYPSAAKYESSSSLPSVSFAWSANMFAVSNSAIKINWLRPQRYVN